MQQGGDVVGWQRVYVGSRSCGVDAALQPESDARGREVSVRRVGAADHAHTPAKQAAVSPERQRKGFVGGRVDVLRAHERACVAEDGVDARCVPQLVDGDEGVLERRRVAYAAEPDTELALPRVANGDEEVTHLGALDFVAVGVHDHVVAVADVEELVQLVVHVPRAAAVDH